MRQCRNLDADDERMSNFLVQVSRHDKHLYLQI